MARYGVGIIGAGWVAGEYVKVFRDHPLTEVVGVYNRTPGKATNALLKRTGSRRESTRPSTSSSTTSASASSSPAPTRDLRREHCVRAAQTGRHIVIEKPVGLTLEETLAIREAVAKAGVKTVTSFVLRWNPQFETVQAADQGRRARRADLWRGRLLAPDQESLPRLRLVRHQRAGAERIRLGGCHAVDILRYPRRRDRRGGAFSAAEAHQQGLRVRASHRRLVQFANGAVGKLSTILDADTPYIFNCQLFGTEGSISNNKVYSSKHYPGSLGYWTFPTIEPDSGDVDSSPVRAGDRALHGVHRDATPSRTPRSTTPGSRWPSASRSTSRLRRAASRCESRWTERRRPLIPRQRQKSVSGSARALPWSYPA